MSGYVFPAPDFTRISSMAGNRVHPVTGQNHYHSGIDIAAPGGSPVVAPTDLTVVRSYYSQTGGNTVVGVDDAGNSHTFMHLSARQANVGDNLSAGMQLGKVGSTGRSTGNHLHYSIKDRAGNLLTDATNGIKNALRKEAGKAVDALIPTKEKLINFAKSAAKCGGNPACMGADLLGDTLGIGGGGDGCGTFDIICKLKKWLSESEFVERMALYIIGTIFIIAAFLMLTRGINPVSSIAKNAIGG